MPMRSLRGPGAALLALSLSLSLAPAAMAQQDFRKLADDFRNDGAIDGCDYSEGQLRKADGQTPPDVEQYAPAFSDSLDAARQQRASGGCSKKRGRTSAGGDDATGGTTAAGGGGSPPAPGQRSAKPGDPAAPPSPTKPLVEAARPLAAVPKGAGPGSSPPAIVWALFAVSGLALLAGLASALAWYYGWDPDRFTRPIRAGFVEAGGRAADGAGTFGDWLRLGR